MAITNRGFIRLACAVAMICVAGGCGKGFPTKVIYGTVKVGNVTPDSGYVRFVPVEGTLGPVSSAAIVQGQYRIDARGGAPHGKHRVEVVAMRKTGRKVMQDGVETDELKRFGPGKYASAQSPLVIEVPDASDGQIDVQIPRK